MPASFSLNTQGAIPQIAKTLGFDNSQPQSRGSSGILTPNAPNTQSSTVGKVTGVLAPNMSVAPKTSSPGILDHASPSTPVKKQTTNNVDGSSTTTEYHAPADNSASTISPAPKENTSTPTPTTTPTQIPGVLASGQQTPQEKETYSGLFNSANEANDPNSRISQAYKNKQDLENAYAKAVGSTQAGGGIPLEFQEGRAQGYAAQYGQQEQAANTAVANALAGQGQQISGLTAANSAAQTQAGRATDVNKTILGAVAPQYGVQPGTLVGQPGQPNGGIDQNYLGGITAPANIKSAQDFTSQINTTQKSRDTLTSLAGQIAPNMGTTGFNPTSSPVGNQTFQQYFKEKDPAAYSGILEGLSEVKNQISNVISSATGLTPTGVTNALDSVDLTTLNPKQLNDFLLYIDQFAQSNIGAAQKGIDRIKSGGNVSSNPGVLPETTQNSTAQALIGTGANLAKGLIGKILDQAGNAVAGGVAGAASKILM